MIEHDVFPQPLAGFRKKDALQAFAEPKHPRHIDDSHFRNGLPQTNDIHVPAESTRTYPLPPKPRVKNVLAEDLKTPDDHVERDPRLIRLTGIHPFNVEAPLSELYDQGFLTTEDLHYVRNHGPVPRCEDERIMDWEFTVEGMVEHPMTVTLRGLLSDFQQRTYPITLVCAGNRRKEQNVIRKSKGFSWGAAGLSTALWTGVALRDILKRARPQHGARYVCFEGADALPNGRYGTSLKLGWCLDPNRGIMIAHKMNGQTLHPDHGRPVRCVVPGQIGGRSVKWLKKIVLTPIPSDNWYHIYDNRVLPTMITPEASADMPETWKDESYAIYDLNVNSAICYPAHDEVLSSRDGIYRVRGYAYGGGGKRITRTEISLDQGKSWRLATMSHPEDAYRDAPQNDILYGGHVDVDSREASFCWSFWELEIPIDDLYGSDDLMVRAMDEGMMIQPRDMYWSVLGMMNNPWFRVVIQKTAEGLRFEHPTQPALRPGGWMERIKRTGGDLTNGFWGERIGSAEGEAAVEPEPEREIVMTDPKVSRQVSLDEFEQHKNDSEPWFALDGEVYDGTGFLEGHPGGAVSITGAAGTDATEEFMAIHSENAKAMMAGYHIGTLDEESKKILRGSEDGVYDTSRPVFLQSSGWSKARLDDKIKVSADSFIFVFALDHEDQQIGLPTGKHLLIRLRDPVTGEAIIRSYTPLSEATERGKLRVLIKIYYDTPETTGGKMTKALDATPLGRSVDFKGPVGRFEYLGRGWCRIGGVERWVQRLVMVCAGSGVTPIFQILRAVMADPKDCTKCLVLDGNRVEQDILCREDLDRMTEANPEKCRLLYYLSRPGNGWVGRRGRLDQSVFSSEIGPPSETCGRDQLALICGPAAMEEGSKTAFLSMGWEQDDLIYF